MEPTKSGMCACPHHKMPGVLLAVFGLVFLLGNLNILTSAAVSFAWPIVVILGGLMKMMSGKCKCCSGMMCMHCGNGMAEKKM